jgi:DNA-binding NarL/FixJ family response regulator
VDKVNCPGTPASDLFLAVHDLFFAAKIELVATALGFSACRASRPSACWDELRTSGVRLVIVDLDSNVLAPIGLVKKIKADVQLSATHVIGFFSHVRHELKRAAQEAGCDRVLPRSAFSARLAEILSTEMDRVR